MTCFSRVVGLIDRVIDGECAKIKRKKRENEWILRCARKKKDKN